MISSTAGKVTFEAEEITQRKVMLLLQLIGTQDEPTATMDTKAFEEYFVPETETETETEKEEMEHDKKWYEYGDSVKVALDCPACNTKRQVYGRYGNRYTKCPDCFTKLHNDPATVEGFGVKDDEGNFYSANSIHYTDDEQRELKKVFGNDGE